MLNRLETPRSGSGKWLRNFPRVCPFCGDTFLSWAPDPWPSNWEPHTEDRTLSMEHGHRLTCGHPQCTEDAQNEHFDYCQQVREMARQKRSLERAAEENEAKMTIDRER